jgi:tetratricopeptide (TPR) repeat protein
MATMMELPAEELERMQFFEQARARAEQDHKANPSDAQVLTRWGGALLELAHFKQGPEAVEMIELAVSKFEAALAINPKKHDALWCLGNALTSQGFLFQEAERAGEFFDKAKVCFQRALSEEPTNEIYKKALEMTDKAPGLHAELQRQLAEQQAQQEAARAAQMGARGAYAGASGDDFWYDVGGWVCFAGIALSWVVMLSRQQAAA